MSDSRTTRVADSRWGKVWGIVSVAGLALTLLALAFIWPSAESEPDGVSIAVTGQSEVVAGFVEAAEDELGEGIDLVTVDDRDAAVAGIEQRELIGAVVLGEQPEVLTASANGQAPTAIMNAVASQVQTNVSGQVYAGVTEQIQNALTGGGGDPAQVADQLPESLPTVQVTDIVPLSEGDSNGVGMIIAGVPLTVGTLLVSVLISFTVVGRWQRVSAVTGLSAGGGLLLALVLGTWLEVYPGSFGLIWLALSLSLAATSALFVGMHSLLGLRGLGISGVLTLFIAIPWAAFAVPYEFLPAGLGHIGQWLIPGATTTLTRNVSYFPEASVALSWWVLVVWAVFGLALTMLARVQRENRLTAD